MMQIAKLVIVMGGALLALGLVLYLLARFNIQIPFGRLPGDIRIENGNFRVYIPLASMLLLSVVLSLVLNLLLRLFGRK